MKEKVYTREQMKRFYELSVLSQEELIRIIVEHEIMLFEIRDYLVKNTLCDCDFLVDIYKEHFKK